MVIGSLRPSCVVSETVKKLSCFTDCSSVPK
jgi:hypothetical protein